MTRIRKRAAAAALTLLLFLPAALIAGDGGCFTIVAGKRATADGSVLVGHNEDNGIRDVAGMIAIPRATHEAGEWVALPGGGRIPQKETTFAYWWLHMPGLQFSDALCNEFGLAVVSDSCPSREDRTDLTEGGISGVVLRRLVAERCRTAREGVLLVGSLVEKWGYAASGRTLIIADPNEAWFAALVRGRHWAAARVPDGEAALIANTYTLRELDLSDTENVLACPDLAAYAEKRGWYDPASGPFSFEAAYASRRSRVHPGNTHRQWSGLNLVAGRDVPLPEKKRLPFSVAPRAPLTPADLARVLRDHYEGTPFAKGGEGEAGNPHLNPVNTICGPRTNSSSIFRLKSGLPREIGVLWRLALWQPCSSPYIPLYPFAMTAVPPALALPQEGKDGPEPAPAYALFGGLARWIDADYPSRIESVRKGWALIEGAERSLEKPLEGKALELWEKDRPKAREILCAWCAGCLERTLDRARNLMKNQEAPAAASAGKR